MLRSLLGKSSHVLTLIVLAALVVSIGCSSTNLPARALPNEYRAVSQVGRGQMKLQGLASYGAASTMIGPGDLLEVSVMSGRSDESVEPMTVRVAENGVVDIPYIGAVAISGVEPTLAADRIAAAAIERQVYVRPQVNVVVEEQATNRITVLGAVEKPGVQEVPRSACDVLAAVAHAGGFTDEAGTVVEVLRHNSPVFTAENNSEDQASSDEIQQVAYQSPNGAPSSTPESRTQRIDLAKLDPRQPLQYRLSDRDVVVVRQREKRLVHVTGLVKEPDQFELPVDQDLRVLDAVAMAGGVTSTVADKIIVVRHLDTQQAPIVAEVSIARAKKETSENLVLQAGDLVSVEQTVATTVVDTFNQLFRITMGVGGNLSLF